MAQSDSELATEQAYVDRVYDRLSELTAQVERQLRAMQGNQMASTHQNRSERDSFAAMYEDRLAALRSVGDNAVFGRLVTDDGESRYIGRIGVFTAERVQLLVDWRAPAASPFYRATSAHRMGVALRRHLLTRNRRVTAIEDDVLNTDVLADESEGLQGEGALLAAVNAQRTGRMGDIVATIQGEQDRIIRAETRGVLVVQGGPGTGKTAVALHRAAYLLYTHRRKLASAGVLIVAPNSGFLRYISRVLPSLGETGVVLQTPGQLLPGLDATTHDDGPVATVKGSLRMREVVANAVRLAQRLPEGDSDVVLDGVRITLRRADMRRARGEARSAHRPHNRAREIFVRSMLEKLTTQYEQRLEEMGRTVVPEDRAERTDDLRRERDVRVALNLAWMPYTPQSLLRMLFSKPHRLREAAPMLSEHEISLLYRPKESPWTVEDVPLLDEAAELLGQDDAVERAARRREQREREAGVAYAQEVIDTIGESPFVRAEDLAAQMGESTGRRPLAERAAEDRTWAYGHVVVDEAQELSPMMWHVLMRRVPTKSLTIVGDLAQASSEAAADSWRATLTPFVGDRFTVERLSVNYRTPRAVMDLAYAVAAAHDVPAERLESVRAGDAAPLLRRAAPGTTVSAVAEEIATMAGALPGGRLAVITREGLAASLHAALTARAPVTTYGLGSLGIDEEIAVMSAQDAKGLEFDGVIVVEPAEILRAHPKGAGDLYVALTRPTQLLTVVHEQDLPEGFTSTLEP